MADKPPIRYKPNPRNNVEEGATSSTAALPRNILADRSIPLTDHAKADAKLAPAPWCYNLDGNWRVFATVHRHSS